MPLTSNNNLSNVGSCNYDWIKDCNNKLLPTYLFVNWSKSFL